MNTILASNFTLDDWYSLRTKLLRSDSTASDWEKAFGHLEERWRTRYLKPMDWIDEKKSKAIGQGFSIMTIACCLLEAVASAYYGRVYHYEQPVRTKIGDLYAYSAPEKNYVPMLTDNDAFSLPPDSAWRFYRAIRCGLIHEARTKAETKIRKNSWDTKIMSGPENGEIIINRHAFVSALKQSIQQLKFDVVSNKGDSRHKLGRHLDWAFGVCDGLPAETIEKIDMLQKEDGTWWPTPS